MRLRTHRQHEDDSETGIDLAPMLDFVLNLLIFFIITAVFVKEVGITVSRPSTKNQQQQQDKKPPKTILIQVLQTGEIVVNGRVVDLRAVRANVERMHALKPENGVMIVADTKAGTGILVQVVDQVRQGGVDNVSFGATR